MAPKPKTTEEYLKEIKIARIDYDNFDYSETIYYASNKKSKFICKKHGPFFQIASNHLRGYGCNICGEESKKEKINLEKSLEYFEKIKIIHGDFYDYSKTIYTHSEEFLIVICKKHGPFNITANNHLQGTGCKKCFLENKANKNIDLLNKSNNKNFDYSEANYTGTRNNIDIYCKILDFDNLEHGWFSQNANNHLNQGKGCPKCAKKYDITESEIVDYIKSLNIGDIKLNDRKILNGKELDIYIPELKIAIEYNGLYWHSDLFKGDNYHKEKTEYCLKQGIQLIHIFEDEWINKKEIVKSRLRYILGKTENITYGRKCIVKEIYDKSIVKSFLERNHIQGNIGYKIALGLYYITPDKKEYLISIMIFGSLRKNLGNKSSEGSYELLRFCNVINYSVIGGASKLLKYFELNYSPEFILSYADRRWSQGNLYEKLNFTLSHKSPPSFSYINVQKRINRFNYRKDILVSKYNCSHEDTARNFTKNVLGLNRIYDCGTLVYNKKY